MAADTGNDNGGAISGINVTPLVDVMLVLLVIFMVTAPIMQQGITMELPQASGGASIEGAAKSIIVSVAADGGVFVGEDSIDLVSLAGKVRKLVESAPGQFVYVRGDRRARYGDIVEVMAVLKSSGATKVGLITEPGGRKAAVETDADGPDVDGQNADGLNPDGPGVGAVPGVAGAVDSPAAAGTGGAVDSANAAGGVPGGVSVGETAGGPPGVVPVGDDGP